MAVRALTANPARRAKAEKGLYPFLIAYAIKNEPLTLPICDWHKELCSEIDRALRPKMHFRGAFPREHGKTTIGTKLTTVYAAATGIKKFILIIGANMKEAEMKLDGVMDALTWPEIVADYGASILPAVDERKNRDVKNTVSEVQLANGCLLVACEAMGRQRGKLSRGKRPDLIILDDPEDDERVLNKDWRLRFRNIYVKKVLIYGLDSERGSSIWMGTLLHPDSPLHHEIHPRDPVMRNNPYVRRRTYNAHDPRILVGPDNVTPDEENGVPKVLWPQRWPYNKQMEYKTLNGPAAFQSEMMNDPRDPEGQVFKPEEWSYYNYHWIVSIKGRWGIIPGKGAEPQVFDQVVCYCDPAFTKDKGDYTALVTIGYRAKPQRYHLIAIHRQKVNPQGVVDLMVQYEDVWKPDRFGVEMIALQDVVLREEVEKRLRCKVIKIRNNANKSIRIETLAAPFETGTLVIPDPWNYPQTKMIEALIEEASQFPGGLNDDMLDALAGGIGLLKTRGTGFHYAAPTTLALAGNIGGY